eukprot:Em0006g1074a
MINLQHIKHHQLIPIGEINPHQWEHIKRHQSIPIGEFIKLGTIITKMNFIKQTKKAIFNVRVNREEQVHVLWCTEIEMYGLGTRDIGRSTVLVFHTIVNLSVARDLATAEHQEERDEDDITMLHTRMDPHMQKQSSYTAALSREESAISVTKLKESVEAHQLAICYQSERLHQLELRLKREGELLKRCQSQFDAMVEKLGRLTPHPKADDTASAISTDYSRLKIRLGSMVLVSLCILDLTQRLPDLGSMVLVRLCILDLTQRLPDLRILSQRLDDHSFGLVIAAVTDADKARLLSTSAPHAASWLSVVPSVGLGLHLDSNELQIAVKWWLGLDT